METITGADMDVIVNAREPTIYPVALEPIRLRHRKRYMDTITGGDSACPGSNTIAMGRALRSELVLLAW
jgi:hypothetical protein